MQMTKIKQANSLGIKHDSIIMSIKPKYIDCIFSRTKKYEFRRKIFPPVVNRVIMYSSSPVRKVVGEFKVGGIIKGRPEEIWKCCRNYAGITEVDFFNYFKGVKDAYAIEIWDVQRYEKEMFINAYGVSAPQFYVYV